MTKVTISEAIRLAGVSRSHFYKKYINEGVISISSDGDKKLIDISELIRVFPNIQVENKYQEQNQTSVDTKKDKVIHILEEQLKEAKEREEWLKQQIDELRKQQNNLLEDKTTKKRKKLFGIF